MRIIYYSYWGTYAAYMMAALHTGVYSPEEFPDDDRIRGQYEMCRRYGEQAGNLIYVGLDEDCREVYTLGCRRHEGMLVRAIRNMNVVFDIREPVLFFPARPREGILPYYLQHRRFRNGSRCAKWFHTWFLRHYKACAGAVEEIKQSLKDGT